jgi:hypothetical protein
VVLQWCYSGVIDVSQWCYRCPISALRAFKRLESLRVITCKALIMVLQKFYSCVTAVL